MEKSKFIKGAEFDGEGLRLEVVKMEKFTPADSQYGVKNQYGAGGVIAKKNYFVDKGILNEGESFRYSFKEEDKDREFENNSVRFYFAYENAKLVAGDRVHIKRNKISNTDVQWTIKKL